MVVGLNAVLQHDLQLSAKTTGKVLAVVKTNGREEIQEIDLKQVSIWGKIKLWWNNSLSKETITNFVSCNYKEWTNEIGTDQEKKAQFETQCAHLARKMKILFVHCPTWNLKVNLEYTDPVLDKTQNVEIPLLYDRLTTLENIIEAVKQRRITIASTQSTPTFGAIFDRCSFSDERAGKASHTPFISKDETGHDRVCKITFSDLNKARLLEVTSKHAAIQARNAYRHVHPDLSFTTGALLGTAIGVAASSGRIGRRH